MAIAYVVSSRNNITLPTGSGTTSITVNAGSGSDTDKYSAASLGYRNAAGHATNAMRLNTISMTAFGASIVNSGALIRGFGLATGAANLASASLAVDTSGGAGTQGASLTIMTYSGIDQATPFDGYVTGGSTSGDTFSITVTSAVGDVPIWMGEMRAQGTFTPTNCTLRYQGQDANGNSAVGGEGVGAASVAMSAQTDFGFSNGWSIFGLNLNVASGGADTTLAASLTATASIATNILTQITFAATISAEAILSSDILTQIHMSANMQANAALQSDLLTEIQLGVLLSGLAIVEADLIAGPPAADFVASLLVTSEITAALVTDILMSVALQAEAHLSADLEIPTLAEPEIKRQLALRRILIV